MTSAYLVSYIQNSKIEFFVHENMIRSVFGTVLLHIINNEFKFCGRHFEIPTSAYAKVYLY